MCAQSYREQSGHIPNTKHQEALGLLSQAKPTLESSRKYARINHKDARKPYLGRVKARGPRPCPSGGRLFLERPRLRRPRPVNGAIYSKTSYSE